MSGNKLGEKHEKIYQQQDHLQKRKKNTQKRNDYDVTSSLTSNQRSVHIALVIKIN